MRTNTVAGDSVFPAVERTDSRTRSNFLGPDGYEAAVSAWAPGICRACARLSLGPLAADAEAMLAAYANGRGGQEFCCSCSPGRRSLRNKQLHHLQAVPCGEAGVAERQWMRDASMLSLVLSPSTGKWLRGYQKHLLRDAVT